MQDKRREERERGGERERETVATNNLGRKREREKIDTESSTLLLPSGSMHKTSEKEISPSSLSNLLKKIK